MPVRMRYVNEELSVTATAENGSHATNPNFLEHLKDTDDPVAWHEFKELYWDLIAGWARIYGCSRRQIRDVFQETMFCLMRDIQDIDHLRQEGGFRHYLRKLVLHCVIDAFSRHPAAGPPEEPTATSGSHGGEDTLWKKSVISQSLRQASRDSDNKAYRAFCYIGLDGMDCAEAAAKLGVRRDEARRLHACFLRVLKEDLRRFLLDSGEDMSVGDLLGSDCELLETVRELAVERDGYQQTIIMPDMLPTTLDDRLGAVRERLRANPAPSGSTANVLLISGEKAAPPGPGKKPSLEQILLDRNVQGRWLKLKHNQVIGRADSCDVILPGKGVSRFHASISESRRGWTVRDQQSTNGVSVNGERTTNSPLKNGDIIQISSRYIMVFSERKLNQYMDLQLKYLRWWSQHYRVTLEEATWAWIKTGLAEKFAAKYRTRLSSAASS